jgi:hypothetical protein
MKVKVTRIYGAHFKEDMAPLLTSVDVNAENISCQKDIDELIIGLAGMKECLPDKIHSSAIGREERSMDPFVERF